jgi:hypothetical protein
MRTLPFVFAGGLLAATTTAAPGAERFVESLRPPSGQSVVVAEGDLEPRSLGSYSLRLYSARNPEFPLDDFLSGVIRPRDGTIARVLLEDLDGDQKPEVLVVKQGAGSGGHLSADAFRVGRDSLSWLASVAGLDPGRDPAKALRTKLRAGLRH